MSSTNVHSDNPQIVGGQTIPTENNIEIPPKSTGKGPSRVEVKIGEGIEIPAISSILHKDGRLVEAGGKQVAQFKEEEFNKCINNNRKRRAEKKAAEKFEEK